MNKKQKETRKTKGRRGGKKRKEIKGLKSGKERVMKQQKCFSAWKKKQQQQKKQWKGQIDVSEVRHHRSNVT